MLLMVMKLPNAFQNSRASSCLAPKPLPLLCFSVHFSAVLNLDLEHKAKIRVENILRNFFLTSSAPLAPNLFLTGLKTLPRGETVYLQVTLVYMK